MKLRCKTTVNRFPQMQAAIQDLNGTRVNVGVFGEQAWLAGIHEYGCTIVPKNVRYLTVPCNPKAKGKRAKDFPELFPVTSKEGTKFLAIPKGKNGFEILFVLMKKVVIPERAFLRTGHDQNVTEVLNQVETQLPAVLSGRLAAGKLAELAGQLMASAIKDAAADLRTPPNHWTTTETKQSSNPLADTGDMIGSITYEVER